MGSTEVIGIDELLGYEDDEGDCKDVTWVELEGISNPAEKFINH